MNFDSRRGWWLLVVATMVWLLWMTLRPDSTFNKINLIPMSEHGQALACLIDNDCSPGPQVFWFLLVDVIGNIIVFVPLGIGLAGALHQTNIKQTIRRVALGGFIFSLMIELIQLTIPTRATDVDDLIFNTVGVTVGALFFALFYRLKFSPGDL
jgi:glycopeptide antibiotics resistance protein